MNGFGWLRYILGDWRTRQLVDDGTSAFRRVWTSIRKLFVLLLVTAGSAFGSFYVVRYFGLDFESGFNTSALLAALISGLFSALIIAGPYQEIANASAETWNRVSRKLLGKATPDAGYFSPRVELQTDRNMRRFDGQFRRIPMSRPEIMLMLRQTDRPLRANETQPYGLNSMQNQVYEKIAKNASRLEKIDWACLVTKDGEFVAYQSFKDLFQNLYWDDKKQYEEMLNARTVDDFKRRVFAHKQMEMEGSRDPLRIRNLRTQAVFEGLSKEELLAVLTENNLDDVMLVSVSDRVPVGVVTLKQLIADTLLDVSTSKEKLTGILVAHPLLGTDKTKPDFETSDAPAPISSDSNTEYDSEDDDPIRQAAASVSEGRNAVIE